MTCFLKRYLKAIAWNGIDRWGAPMSIGTAAIQQQVPALYPGVMAVVTSTFGHNTEWLECVMYVEIINPVNTMSIPVNCAKLPPDDWDANGN
ncbi:hypothetical protein J6590_030711 [Homalodisca vitripennis]|nr:hypothetical protein J6590_030711 [Homalodisca vitripennis]